jgi:hypothetical protein
MLAQSFLQNTYRMAHGLQTQHFEDDSSIFGQSKQTPSLPLGLSDKDNFQLQKVVPKFSVLDFYCQTLFLQMFPLKFFG